MAIGPFSNFDGRLDPIARAEKMEELQLWFEIARILGTDLIQIPCHFMPEGQGVTGDPEVVARDMRQIADLGKGEFRFAYENLCWGTYNDMWSKAWQIVQLVDRDNFGLCLDTFNIAGREWADPTAANGKVANADALFRESLRCMVAEVDVRKVFYVQVVDAERLKEPLDERHPFHVEGQKPRMSWSRNARLFMLEEDRGGYLPVLEVLKAICDEETGLGYKGWISAELFNRSLMEEGDMVPREHAERCMDSWWKIVKAMGWEGVVDVRSEEGVEVRKSEMMARL
jgi:4-hydroxyphenylpyruvate dioxygenase